MSDVDCMSLVCMRVYVISGYVCVLELHRVCVFILFTQFFVVCRFVVSVCKVFLSGVVSDKKIAKCGDKRRGSVLSC